MKITDDSLFKIFQPSQNSCYATTLHIAFRVLDIKISIRSINKLAHYNLKYGVHEGGAETRINEDLGKKYDFVIKSKNNLSVDYLKKIIADKDSSPPILILNIEYLNLHGKKFQVYPPMGPEDQVPQHQIILNDINEKESELVDTYIPYYDLALKNPLKISTPKLLNLWFENSAIWVEHRIKQDNLIRHLQ